jgi:uncharacterized protein YcgI (DUF1989 family)
MAGSTATQVQGSTFDRFVEARGNLAFEMSAGQTLTITDLEGQQAVDVICYSLENLSEKLWSAHSTKLNHTIYLSTGHTLYSDLARPMMTIVEDTCGENDILCGSCSTPLDAFRYGPDKALKGCMENFEEAIAPWGLERKDIPMCFNAFMRYQPQEDGSIAIGDAPSKPGDALTFRAEMDLLVAISNCPQEFNPVNGGRPTAIQVALS